MHWLGKAGMMQAFSYLPLGNELHYMAQRRVTRSLPSSDEKFYEIFEQAREHLEALRRHSDTRPEDANFYEFGAGFELGIPLSFNVLGVLSQTVIDIRKLLRIELVNEILMKLKRVGGENGMTRSLQKLLEQNPSDDWVVLLHDWYGIQYQAPCDARNTGLPSASFDFVRSTNTLEHIPMPDIRLIFRECFRLLKKSGLMSFLIDYQDHYSYGDRRISVYNFLKYSDSTWRWFNPPLHYQNRLRHRDYIRLLQETGFEVVEETALAPSHQDLMDLSRAGISRQFRDAYDLTELGVRRSHIVARAIL